jgi:hypothetical protein
VNTREKPCKAKLIIECKMITCNHTQSLKSLPITKFKKIAAVAECAGVYFFHSQILLELDTFLRLESKPVLTDEHKQDTNGAQQILCYMVSNTNIIIVD